MSAQPEALRLAAELEAPVGTQSTYSAMQQAAAELRRLQAEYETLKKSVATAWNRGHTMGMRANEDIARQALEVVKKDAWANTQLTEALLKAEEQCDALTEANEAFSKREHWWNEKMFTLEQQRDALMEALERYQVKRQDFDRFADEITALRAALAQQEHEPTARYKCTVVDAQHPNGVPFERWVNAPQQEPVAQMRENALARWAHEQEEPPDTGWQRDWQRGYETARRWVRQVGLPSLAQQDEPKGGGNLPPPLQAEPVEEPVACECHRCIKEKDLRDPSGMLPLNMSKMILCAECGNKRCPKASDHMLACTGSNEPGQSGSVYAHPPRREWQGLTDDEISALFPLSLRSDYKPYSFARAIEAKLKEKNA